MTRRDKARSYKVGVSDPRTSGVSASRSVEAGAEVSWYLCPADRRALWSSCVLISGALNDCNQVRRRKGLCALFIYYILSLVCFIYIFIYLYLSINLFVW